MINCKHPKNWALKLRHAGISYTYCLGCLIEKIGLDNRENRDNPYIKKTGVSETKVKTTKEKK